MGFSQTSLMANVDRSSFDGLFKIARHEGLQSLWRGTDAAVLLTVPLVAIYLPLYDHLLERCAPAGAASVTAVLNMLLYCSPAGGALVTAACAAQASI